MGFQNKFYDQKLCSLDIYSELAEFIAYPSDWRSIERVRTRLLISVNNYGTNTLRESLLDLKAGSLIMCHWLF